MTSLNQGGMVFLGAGSGWRHILEITDIPSQLLVFPVTLHLGHLRLFQQVCSKITKCHHTAEEPMRIGR